MVDFAFKECVEFIPFEMRHKPNEPTIYPILYRRIPGDVTTF